METEILLREVKYSCKWWFIWLWWKFYLFMLDRLLKIGTLKVITVITVNIRYIMCIFNVTIYIFYFVFSEAEHRRTSKALCRSADIKRSTVDLRADDSLTVKYSSTVTCRKAFPGEGWLFTANNWLCVEVAKICTVTREKILVSRGQIKERDVVDRFRGMCLMLNAKKGIGSPGILTLSKAKGIKGQYIQDFNGLVED